MDIAVSVGGAVAATLGVIGAVVNKNRRRNNNSNSGLHKSIDNSAWDSLQEGQLVAIWYEGRQVGYTGHN